MTESLRGSRSTDNRSYPGRDCPTAQKRKEKLDVEHAILQAIVNPTPFFLSIFEHLFLGTLALALVVLRNEVRAEVASSTLAGQVGVVGRWDQADRLRRTNVLVAEVMGTLLHHVGIEPVLIVDDNVVGRSNLSLETGMRLQVEIEQERRREAPVLNCSGKGVAIVRFLFGRRRVESAVVSLPTDDDGDLRLILSLDFLESLPHFRIELFFDHVIILSLGSWVSPLVSFEDSKLPTSLTPSLYTITRLGKALLAALNACSLSTIISVRSVIIY